MAQIITREVGLTAKNSPLTVEEFDSNINNLHYELRDKFDTTSLKSYETITNYFKFSSPIISLSIYDPTKDSDGGNWTEKVIESRDIVTGKWLGVFANQAEARSDNGFDGDYYLNSTDNKLYKLTSGTETEIFIGNKATFPKLVGIINLGSRVILVDLLERNYPVWGVYTSTNCTNAKMINAKLVLGEAGVNVVDVFRNSSVNLGITGTINDIDVCELGNANCDILSGLNLPTIGIATSTGLKIYTNTERIVNSLDTESFTNVNINYKMITGSKNDNLIYYANSPNTLSNDYSLTTITVTGNSSKLLAGTRSKLFRTSGNKVNVINNNEENNTASITADISHNYNTGYLINSKRCYITDITTGNITGNITDRSNGSTAQVVGTLTGSKVNTGSDLVAYSGFSNSNYIQENYTTGLSNSEEYCASAWVTIPTVLDAGIFPEVGDNLITNGTFDTDINGWTSVSERPVSWDSTLQALKIGPFTSNYNYIAENIVNGIIGGSLYKFSFDILDSTSTPKVLFYINIAIGVTGAILTGNISSLGNYVGYFVAPLGYTSLFLSFGLGVGTDAIGIIDNIVIQEILPANIVDTLYYNGPRLLLSIAPNGHIFTKIDNGLSKRYIKSVGVYNNNTPVKLSTTYSKDGTLSILVNGKLTDQVFRTPLTTTNANTEQYCYIGNNPTINTPFPGSISLVKLSGTVPTKDQELFMYEQEKVLFNSNSKCVLPENATISDISYDKTLDNYTVTTPNYLTTFNNLQVINSKNTPTYSKVSSNNKYKLVSKADNTVDVITPLNFSHKEELSEATIPNSTKLETFDYIGGFSGNITNGSYTILSVANLTYPLEYIGAMISGTGIPENTYILNVSGTTIYMSNAATATTNTLAISFRDFYLPVGYKAKVVKLAGLVKQKGSTKDYITLYDGFKKKVRFHSSLVGAALNSTAQVSIQACQYNNI